jgi:hypothetical protein
VVRCLLEDVGMWVRLVSRERRRVVVVVEGGSRRGGEPDQQLCWPVLVGRERKGQLGSSASTKGTLEF